MAKPNEIGHEEDHQGQKTPEVMQTTEANADSLAERLIQLPSIKTVEGVVARLLIAESRNPGHPHYDEAHVRRGMQAMKAVVHNRLHNHPKQFNAPGARDYIDIITAPGQFHGFSKNHAGNVVIKPKVQHNIDEVMRIANTGAPGKYFRFVQNVINVAKGGISDPFAKVKEIDGEKVTGGGYGWRTAGASDPGGDFRRIPEEKGGIIAGNQFYTLRQGSTHAQTDVTV